VAAITEALLPTIAAKGVQSHIQTADLSILFRPDEAVTVAAYRQDPTADHPLLQIIPVLQDLNREAHIPEDHLLTHPDHRHHHTRQVHLQDLLLTAVHQDHHRGEDRL
jgi:hypothetical protein